MHVHVTDWSWRSSGQQRVIRHARLQQLGSPTTDATAWVVGRPHCLFFASRAHPRVRRFMEGQVTYGVRFVVTVREHAHQLALRTPSTAHGSNDASAPLQPCSHGGPSMGVC
jgi:hypothetical protein